MRGDATKVNLQLIKSRMNRVRIMQGFFYVLLE